MIVSEGVRKLGVIALVSLLAPGAPCWALNSQDGHQAAQRAQEKKPAEQPPQKTGEKPTPPADDKPDRTEDHRGRVRRVFQLKHVDPVELLPMLSVFPVERYANSRFRTLSVLGTAEMVAAVEDVIRRFDLPAPPAPPPAPSKNIDLTVHLLVGQDQPATEAMPSALQGVVGQLTSLFAYKGYRLAETLMMRTRDGHEGSASGVISIGSSPPLRAPYEFSFRRATVGAGDKERQIRIDRLRLKVDVPFRYEAKESDDSGKPSPQFVPAGLTTDIDVREGQKVVVGKATVDGSSQALILVVTAKVVE